MSVAISSFINDITPHVSGCPKSVIIKAIRDAAVRLCEDSTIWRDDIPAADITVDVDDYTITPPAGTRVITTISLRYDGNEISGYTEESLDTIDYGWRAGNPGTATAFVLFEPDRIKLNRVPEATIIDGLIAKVALKPTDDATLVGDVIYSDWREAIMHGALERLLRIPKKPWYNIQLSTYHGKHFLFQIQRAKARAAAGFLRKPLSVKPRRWV